MITEKIHKLLTSQIMITDCTKKGLASLILLADWNNSAQVEMSLHSDTLPWLCANQTIF
jgi:hypothetical protein